MFLVMKNKVIVSYKALLVFKKKLSLSCPLFINWAIKVIMPSFIKWVSKVYLIKSELMYSANWESFWSRKCLNYSTFYKALTPEVGVGELIGKPIWSTAFSFSFFFFFLGLSSLVGGKFEFKFEKAWAYVINLLSWPFLLDSFAYWIGAS